MLAADLATTVARRAACALASDSVHVEPHFLDGRALLETRAAAHALRTLGAAAAVGGRNAVDVRARNCVAIDLLADDVLGTLPPALLAVIERIDALRADLAVHTGRPLVDGAELQLLRYPPGGHYAAHVDDGAATASRPVRRSISLLLYLTPDDWQPRRDGGELRVHLSDDGEPSADPRAATLVDVPPLAGTLVLFNSAEVMHEVLPTRRPRMAVVGWLLEPRGTVDT